MSDLHSAFWHKHRRAFLRDAGLTSLLLAGGAPLFGAEPPLGGLIVRQKDPIAIGYLLLLALSIFAVVVVYWNARVPIGGLLTQSAERVVAAPVLLSVAMLPLLISNSFDAGSLRSGRSDERGDEGQHVSFPLTCDEAWGHHAAACLDLRLDGRDRDRIACELRADPAALAAEAMAAGAVLPEQELAAVDVAEHDRPSGDLRRVLAREMELGEPERRARHEHERHRGPEPHLRTPRGPT